MSDENKLTEPPMWAVDEQQRTLPTMQLLSPLQQQYIGLINQGNNDRECAESLGVDQRTLYRWRQNPIFKYWYREITKPLIKRLQTYKPRAITRLGSLINSEDERIALAACLAILKMELEMKVPSRQSEIDDTISQLEKLTSRDERLELAREIRAHLDAKTKPDTPSSGNGGGEGLPNSPENNPTP